jgi:hypothetical protein
VDYIEEEYMPKKSHYHKNNHASIKNGTDRIADDLNTMELSSLITNGRSLTTEEGAVATKSILEASSQDRREFDSVKRSFKSLTP